MNTPHDFHSPHQLLTLIVPWALAEAVEDLLLAHPDIVPGFTSNRTDGHGSEVRLVSAAERVRGHAQRMRFQLLADAAELQQIRALLSPRFDGSGIFYWVTPVVEAGRL